jgi:hypothetical protein
LTTNWQLIFPNGQIQIGSGESVSGTWNGTGGNGSLATPGTYHITLIATNSADNNTCMAEKQLSINVSANGSDDQCKLEVSFGSKSNLATGNLSHSQELFSIGGTSLPLNLTMYYNSLDPQPGSLGRGWGHNYSYSLKVNSDNSVVVRKPNNTYEYFTFTNGTYIRALKNPTIERLSSFNEANPGN